MPSHDRTVILIDGRNYTSRHAYTHRGLSSGKNPTGMLYGCISGMIRLSRLHPNAAIVFVWDGDNSRESWRHKLSPRYKSHRIPKGSKEEKPEKKAMWQQIPIFEQFLDKLGFRQLKVNTLEADDLIGILAFHVRTMVDKVVIYSMDRDFYQFISTEVDVVADIDKSRNCRPLSAKELKKKYAVTPKQWLQYRALVGDKGDGIIGIPKVGPKTAVSLLEAGMLPNKAKCKDLLDNKKWKLAMSCWKQVRLNYKLSKILTTVDNKILPIPVARDCNRLLKQIKAFDDLFRTDKGKEAKQYRWMMEWFAKYEMQEFVERRLELWKLL